MAVRRAHVDMMKQQQMGINELIESSEGDTGTTAETGEWTPVWPSTIRAKVGSVLTSIFLDAAKIPVPSFNPETGEKIDGKYPCILPHISICQGQTCWHHQVFRTTYRIAFT